MYLFNTVVHHIDKIPKFIVYINLAYVIIWVKTYKYPLATMNHKQVVIPNLFIVQIVPAVAEFVGLNRKDCIAD
jgi:hypothetical protein